VLIGALAGPASSRSFRQKAVNQTCAPGGVESGNVTSIVVRVVLP
jgi:hypothetical protein